MFFFCILFFCSSLFKIQKGEEISSYEKYDEFLQAFKTINISKNPQNYYITIDQDIKLSDKDFPIDIPMIQKDHTSFLLYFQASKPSITLTLDIKGMPSDRFQYVAFQNITLSFSGNSIKVQNIVLGENCSVKSTELINLDSVDATMDWSHIHIFKQINFARLYLTYNDKDYKPESFPIFIQKLQWYEGNSIKINLFADSVVSFTSSKLTCSFNKKQFAINIPSYNYTVSFSFVLEPLIKFTISGNYNYNSIYPHYLFILPSEQSQVVLNEGNYMTSKFSYYQDSGMLTVNNKLLFKYLTIDGTAKLKPISQITVKYFDYFSENPIQDSLILSCRVFRATSTSDFHCIDGKTLSIKTMQLAASDPLSILGSVTVNTSMSLYLPYVLTINSLTFENTPTITFEGDFSDSCPEIVAPVHSNGDIKGKANLMISKTFASFPDQHEGQFYPFFSANGTFEINQFELIYDSDETEYGFTKKTSYLQLKKQSQSIGILQTKDYKSPFISLCYGDESLCKNELQTTYITTLSKLSTYINEFTTGIDLIIYKSCDIILTDVISNSINLLVDIRSTSKSKTIATIDMNQNFASKINQLTLEINGELSIKNKIILSGSLSIIIYNGLLKSSENLKFTSSTRLVLNSFAFLNNITNWNQCQYVHIYHENITKFTFINNGWRIMENNNEYEMTNIKSDNILFQPSSSNSNIEFDCLTSSPQFLKIIIGEENTYVFNNIPAKFLPFYITSSAEIILNNKYVPIDFVSNEKIPSNENDLILTINSNIKSINNVIIQSKVDVINNLVYKSTSINTITFEKDVLMVKNLDFEDSITPIFTQLITLENDQVNVNFTVGKMQLNGNTSLRITNPNVTIPCVIKANIDFINGEFIVPQIYSNDEKSQTTINIRFDNSHWNENLDSLSTTLGYKTLDKYIDHLKRQKILFYLTSSSVDTALSNIINDDGKYLILFKDKVIHFQINVEPAVNSIKKEYDTFYDFGNVKKSGLLGHHCVYLTVSDVKNRYSTRTHSKSSGSSDETEVVDNYPMSILGNFPINVAYLGASQLVNFSLPYLVMKKVREFFGHIIPPPNFQHTAIWIGESDESDENLGAIIVYGRYRSKDLSYLSRDGAKAFVASLKEFKQVFTAFDAMKLKVSTKIRSKEFVNEILESGFWTANQYNWPTNNCQHFTAKCISILKAIRTIPSENDWIDLTPDVLKTIINNENALLNSLE